jgi:hypothetical protein
MVRGTNEALASSHKAGGFHAFGTVAPQKNFPPASTHCASAASGTAERTIPSMTRLIATKNRGVFSEDLMPPPMAIVVRFIFLTSAETVFAFAPQSQPPARKSDAAIRQRA